MDHKIFDSKSFNLAVDLAVMDIKRKYIQKILDLYVKSHAKRDYTNVIFTIKFNDGTREIIRFLTKDSWEFYEIDNECKCSSCRKVITCTKCTLQELKKNDQVCRACLDKQLSLIRGYEVVSVDNCCK